MNLELSKRHINYTNILLLEQCDQTHVQIERKAEYTDTTMILGRELESDT